MITLHLPIPPSVNRLRKLNRAELWRAERWKQQADAMVTAQWAKAAYRGRNSRPHLLNQPFGLTIYVSEKYRGDLDNILKAVPDYLRRIEVVTNDSRKYMRYVLLSWCESQRAPEGVRVEVWPWPSTIADLTPMMPQPMVSVGS